MKWNWNDNKIKEVLAGYAEKEMYLQISDADAVICICSAEASKKQIWND